MSTGPRCKICETDGAREGTQYPIFMVAPGYKFGEICVRCNDKYRT